MECENGTEIPYDIYKNKKSVFDDLGLTFI